jgi:hypothetical protein
MRLDSRFSSAFRFFSLSRFIFSKVFWFFANLTPQLKIVFALQAEANSRRCREFKRSAFNCRRLRPENSAPVHGNRQASDSKATKETDPGRKVMKKVDKWPPPLIFLWVKIEGSQPFFMRKYCDLRDSFEA